MADFITQFPANEIVSRENFNSRITQANTAMINIKDSIDNHVANNENPHKVTLPQVGGVRPNLLENVWRTVNQGGLTSLTTTGHLLDRWFAGFSADAQGHVDLVSDGWQITKTAGEYIALGQPFELSFWNSLVERPVTLSALIGNALVSATFIATDVYQHAVMLPGIELAIGNNGANGFIQLVLFSNTTTDVIKHIKLELGAGQTLARQDDKGNWILNDPPPDPEQELSKCQRHYERVISYHDYAYTGELALSVPYKVPKRIAGTTKIISENGTENNISYHDGTKWVDVPIAHKENYLTHVYLYVSNAAIANHVIGFAVFADATL